MRHRHTAFTHGVKHRRFISIDNRHTVAIVRPGLERVWRDKGLMRRILFLKRGIKAQLPRTQRRIALRGIERIPRRRDQHFAAVIAAGQIHAGAIRFFQFQGDENFCQRQAVGAAIKTHDAGVQHLPRLHTNLGMTH